MMNDPCALLRWSLRANASFSAACGVACLVAPAPLARWLGVPEPAILAGLGAGLLGFAAFAVWLSARDTIPGRAAMTVICLDAAWVAGSLPLLVAGPLTQAGLWTVAIVMDAVLAFALLQYAGVRRMARASLASGG